MKYVKEKEYDNTKLINNIIDEEYKKEVLENGYCVALLEDGEVARKESLNGRSRMNLSFILNESLILDIYKMENKMIEHMLALIFIDISINNIELLVTINAVNKKNKMLPIGVSFPYSAETIIIGNITWHKINTSDWEDFKCKEELWMRLDFLNKRGELYFGISETLKNILYLIS